MKITKNKIEITPQEIFDLESIFPRERTGGFGDTARRIIEKVNRLVSSDDIIMELKNDKKATVI